MASGTSTTLVTEDRILAAAGRIASQQGVRRIILFGSAAEGTAGPDSDMDLLVVLDRVGDRHQEQVRFRNLIGDAGCPVDIVVCSEEMFQRRHNVIGSIQYVAASRGRVLHEA